MSKPLYILSAALLIGIAPTLAAQAVGRQAQVTIAPAAVSRMVAAKKKAKGAALPQLSASQRAPDPTTLIVVTGPNGERRLARAKKRIE